MSFLLKLLPIPRWLAVALLACALAAAMAWAGIAWVRGIQKEAYTHGYTAAQKACSDAQAEANRLEVLRTSKERERTRAVELGHAAKQATLTHTITQIITELKNETTNLATCQLDAGDISLLNRAAAAARAAGDTAAPSGAGDALRGPH
jgi:uncharacterized protein HemX